MVVQPSQVKWDIIPIICQGRRCAVLDKEPDDIEMAAQCCPVQGCVAVLVLRVEERLLALLRP